MGRRVTEWSRATQSSARTFHRFAAGGDEHHPRRRADAAHVLINAADAVRAVGVLVAIRLVAVGLDDLHARHLRAEFVCDQHRQRTTDALAHLRAVAHDGDRAVWPDMDEDIGVEPCASVFGCLRTGVGAWAAAACQARSWVVAPPPESSTPTATPPMVRRARTKERPPGDQQWSAAGTLGGIADFAHPSFVRIHVLSGLYRVICFAMATEPAPRSF